jgi:hypothetical protein
MALQAGCRLGPNEVRSLIGAGGTGEVYKAGDTRLVTQLQNRFAGPLSSDGQVQFIRVRRVLCFSEEGAADYPS